jgi:hypothetical protein
MPENRKSTANPSAKFIFAAQTAEVGLVARFNQFERIS